MVLALIKKPFVWVWALITAPLRWLRGGHRRHRRGLFSKVGDLMPTFSFMSFVRGGTTDEALPMQCERDQQPSEEAPPARVVEEEAPPPPKKKRVVWSKKAATTKLQARWRGRKARQNSKRRAPPRRQQLRQSACGSAATAKNPPPLACQFVRVLGVLNPVQHQVRRPLTFVS